jgi:serine/threonine protein kinase
MAPEQVRGERGAIDARADIFSLGAVLFECAAGRPAFEGTHVMALFAKLLLEDAPRLSSLRPDVPPALDALIARMLSKDPYARPANGAAMLEELGKIGGAEGAEPLHEPAVRMAMAITGSEQRLLSVVAAVRSGMVPAQAPSPMAATQASDPWGEHLAAIRTAVLPLDARMEKENSVWL